jgi:hypothetical protein
MPEEILPALSNIPRPSYDLTCGRLTTDPDGHCPKRATWHVMWTSDGTNTLCCEEHMTEARQQWAFYGRHQLGMACTVAGAIFLDGRCVLDEGDGPREAATRLTEGAPTA